MVNICPVCGYSLQYPAADFHICPSCGTEFGFDDASRTHTELRAAWLQGGAQWWSTSRPVPPNWDPSLQLENIFAGCLWQAATTTGHDQQSSNLGIQFLIGLGGHQIAEPPKNNYQRRSPQQAHQGASTAGLSGDSYFQIGA
jgi:hypothetical protein